MCCPFNPSGARRQRAAHLQQGAVLCFFVCLHLELNSLSQLDVWGARLRCKCLKCRCVRCRCLRCRCLRCRCLRCKCLRCRCLRCRCLRCRCFHPFVATPGKGCSLSVSWTASRHSRLTTAHLRHPVMSSLLSCATYTHVQREAPTKSFLK